VVLHARIEKLIDGGARRCKSACFEGRFREAARLHRRRCGRHLGGYASETGPGGESRAGTRRCVKVPADSDPPLMGADAAHVPATRTPRWFVDCVTKRDRSSEPVGRASTDTCKFAPGGVLATHVSESLKPSRNDPAFRPGGGGPARPNSRARPAVSSRTSGLDDNLGERR